MCKKIGQLLVIAGCLFGFSHCDDNDKFVRSLVALQVTPATVSIPLGVERAFSATAIYNDNTTEDVTDQVMWSVDNPSLAAIDDQGIAIGLSVGSTTVRALFDNKTGTAQLTITDAVFTGLQVIPGTQSAPIGVNKAFTATANYSDGSTHVVTNQAIWNSSDEAVATVNATGVATGVSAGQTMVIAMFEGESAHADFTVMPAMLVDLQVTPPSPSIPTSATQAFQATAIYSDQSTHNVTDQANWSSGTPSVATINNDGLVSAVSAGVSVITATFGGQHNSANLTVTANQLTRIQVTPADPLDLPVGLTEAFTATAFYSDNSSHNVTGEAHWVSSRPAVATVETGGSSNPGLVKGVSDMPNNTTDIIATFDGVSSAPVGLMTVDKEVTRIQVTPAVPADLPIGATEAFIATATYTDQSTRNITNDANWISSVAEVASIETSGMGHPGLAMGVSDDTGFGNTTMISAMFSGIFSDSVTLTVIDKQLVNVQVTPAMPADLPVGATEAFIATAIYTDNSTRDVTNEAHWISDDINVATIESTGDSNPGLATGVSNMAPGDTANITATFGTVTSTPVALTVVGAVIESIAVTPAVPTDLPMGATEFFTATATYSDGSTRNVTDNVDWVSSRSGVATIETKGATQPGLATGVSDTPNNTTNITAKFGTVTSNPVTLTVVDAEVTSIAVTPALPTDLPMGATESFTATATYSDGSTRNVTTDVSWFSSDTGVATIETKGTEQPGLATGVSDTPNATTNIRAMLGGVSNDPVVLTVVDAVIESIAVTPAVPTDLPIGATESFTATATYSDGSTRNVTGEVDWVSSRSGVATIETKGATQPGLVTGVSDTPEDTTQITAMLGGVSSNPVTLMVVDAMITDIAVTPAQPTDLPIGATESFTATATYSDGSTRNVTNDVSWFSSDTGVATIETKGAEQPGLATGVSDIPNATTNIRAMLGGVSSAPVMLTVVDAEVTNLAVTPAVPNNLPIGATESFTATATYSDGSTRNVTNDVSWFSSRSGVATIETKGAEQPGLATGVSDTPNATTNIRAMLGGVSSDSVVLTVVDAEVISIAVNPANPATLPIGATERFTATATYSDASARDVTNDVSWFSSDTGVATIETKGAEQPGLATGVSDIPNATTNIRAMLEGVSSDPVVLTVVDAEVISIVVNPADPATLPIGSNEQFTAAATYSDESVRDVTNDVSWFSSNIGVATIATKGAMQPGLATGVSDTPEDTTQITAMLGGVSSDPVVLTVVDATPESISITPAVGVIRPTGTKGAQFTATVKFSDGSSRDVTNDSDTNWKVQNAFIKISQSGCAKLVTPDEPFECDFADLSVVYKKLSAPALLTLNPTCGTDPLTAECD